MRSLRPELRPIIGSRIRRESQSLSRAAKQWLLLVPYLIREVKVRSIRRGIYRIRHETSITGKRSRALAIAVVRARVFVGINRKARWKLVVVVIAVASAATSRPVVVAPGIDGSHERRGEEKRVANRRPCTGAPPPGGAKVSLEAAALP